jgi:hypothetical protein
MTHGLPTNESSVYESLWLDMASRLTHEEAWNIWNDAVAIFGDDAFEAIEIVAKNVFWTGNDEQVPELAIRLQIALEQ